MKKNAFAGTRTRISTLEGWNSALRPQMLTVNKVKSSTSGHSGLGQSRIIVKVSNIKDDRGGWSSCKKIKMHLPGLEPGSPPWKGGILPLDHKCLQ